MNVLLNKLEVPFISFMFQHLVDFDGLSNSCCKKYIDIFSMPVDFDQLWLPQQNCREISMH